MRITVFQMFIALLLLGIGYVVWLDYGCELSGAMTWHGKVCVEQLTN